MKTVEELIVPFEEFFKMEQEINIPRKIQSCEESIEQFGILLSEDIWNVSKYAESEKEQVKASEQAYREMYEQSVTTRTSLNFLKQRPELLRVYAILSLQASINKLLSHFYKAGKLTSLFDSMNRVDFEMLKRQFQMEGIVLDEKFLKQFNTLDDFRAYLYKRANLEFISAESLRNAYFNFQMKTISYSNYHLLYDRAGVHTPATGKVKLEVIPIPTDIVTVERRERLGSGFYPSIETTEKHI